MTTLANKLYKELFNPDIPSNLCNMQKDKTEILESIKDVLQTIVPNAKVILFGSRARGDARKGSDWDLLMLDQPRIEVADFERISYPLFELG
jgi:predicted nucleotidyltransferase